MLEIAMAITKMMFIGSLAGFVCTITMIFGVNAIKDWKDRK